MSRGISNALVLIMEINLKSHCLVTPPLFLLCKSFSTYLLSKRPEHCTYTSLLVTGISWFFSWSSIVAHQISHSCIWFCAHLISPSFRLSSTSVRVWTTFLWCRLKQTRYDNHLNLCKHGIWPVSSWKWYQSHCCSKSSNYACRSMLCLYIASCHQ